MRYVNKCRESLLRIDMRLLNEEAWDAERAISTALQTDTQQASPGGQQAQQYDGRGTNVFAIVRHIECMKSIPVLNDAGITYAHAASTGASGHAE